MTKRPHTTRISQQGFTIIELLIATAVFSVVLLILTFGVIQITDSYYKGVTQSDTQNVARNIINTVSQAIQFGGGDIIPVVDPAGDQGFYCVGGQRFSFLDGKELENNPTSSQTLHALVADSVAGCSSSSTPMNFSSSLSAGQQELLSPNMRVAYFNISSIGNASDLYKVDVRVIYGSDDLLTSSSSWPSQTVTCKGSAGSQFCSVSELSTIVERRVQ